MPSSRLPKWPVGPPVKRWHSDTLPLAPTASRPTPAPQGKVLRVLAEDEKVLVEGMNLRKKHQKPRKQGEKGQVIDAKPEELPPAD